MNRAKWLYAAILLLAVTTIGLFILFQSVNNGSSYQDSSVGYTNSNLLVEPSWLKEHLGDSNIRVVDVRSNSQYSTGHIQGAVNLDYTQLENSSDPSSGVVSPKEFENIVGAAGISSSTTVILYDSSNSLEAGIPFWVFEYYGHKDVRILNGGLQRWVAQGGSIDKVDTHYQEAKYSVTVMPQRLATVDWIMNHLNASGVTILDVRVADEYTGKINYSLRGGHIPGAVNVVWTNAINPDGTFKSQENLTKIYLAAGVTPDKEIVVYCRSGQASSHTYFVLRLIGYPNIREYFKSWSQWGNRLDLPVEK
jgi:thiosulfate/3-mercaptopyruvate sulfurtransferase